MRERVIENYLVQSVKKVGGMCIKMEPRYNVGIPDRLVIHKGTCIFAEVKALGGKPTEKQLRYHSQLRERGVGVCVIDSKEKVDFFIRLLTENDSEL